MGYSLVDVPKEDKQNELCLLYNRVGRRNIRTIVPPTFPAVVLLYKYMAVSLTAKLCWINLNFKYAYKAYKYWEIKPFVHTFDQFDFLKLPFMNKPFISKK